MGLDRYLSFDEFDQWYKEKYGHFWKNIPYFGTVYYDQDKFPKYKYDNEEWADVGHWYHANEDYHNAIDYYEKALIKTPGRSSPCAEYIAQCLYIRGRIDEAIDCLINAKEKYKLDYRADRIYCATMIATEHNKINRGGNLFLTVPFFLP